MEIFQKNKYLNENKTLLESDLKDTNIFNIDYTSDDIYQHTNYLYLLPISSVLFFVLCYYLYLISKIFTKKVKTNSESNIVSLKYNNIRNLSIASFIRGLSLVYIIISHNKSGNDIISFINYILHFYPALLFYSAYLAYSRFLIEKYYEIKTRKSDLFFNPTIAFFNIFIYVVSVLITLSCLTTETFSSYMRLGTGFLCMISFFISFLFLYYGIRLANIYSYIKENNDLMERKFIYNKILFISIVVGFIHLVKAIILFLISVNYFKNSYPMEVNLWDFLNFLFSELIVSLVICYTRKKEDRVENLDKFNLDSFDFNKNYQKYSELIRRPQEMERKEDDNLFFQDFNDPLLDKIDKI